VRSREGWRKTGKFKKGYRANMSHPKLLPERPRSSGKKNSKEREVVVEFGWKREKRSPEADKVEVCKNDGERREETAAGLN